MATCPLCLFASPPGAAVCGRCGRFRFPADEEADPVAVVEKSASQKSIRGTATIYGASPAVAPEVDHTPAPATIHANQFKVGTPPSSKPIETLKSRLVVIRGVRIGAEYPIYDGKNYIGRSADKPVDIDLNGQENAEQVWTSRQHAVITNTNGMLVIEDLNSLNGTFVNRSRIHPGQQRALQANDVVQVGTVQFRVVS